MPIFIFLIVANVERWRVGGYFWNQLGLEYTLMWTVAVLYFLIHGGGSSRSIIPDPAGVLSLIPWTDGKSIGRQKANN